MAKLNKQVVSTVFENLTRNGLTSIEDYAKTTKLSVGYVRFLFGEVRRALKRGDIATTPEIMEHFLRTSKVEAKRLDAQKV